MLPYFTSAVVAVCPPTHQQGGDLPSNCVNRHMLHMWYMVYCCLHSQTQIVQDPICAGL